MNEEHIQIETAFFDSLPSELYGAYVLQIGEEKFRVWGVIVPESYVPGNLLRGDATKHREMIRLIKEIAQAVELARKIYERTILEERNTES